MLLNDAFSVDRRHQLSQEIRLLALNGVAPTMELAGELSLYLDVDGDAHSLAHEVEANRLAA